MTCAKVYTARADLLAKVGRPAEAVVAFGRALDILALDHLAEQLELDEERARLRAHRADALRDVGRLEEALDEYGRAIALLGRGHLSERRDLDGERVELHAARARTLRNAGRAGEALADYDRSLEILTTRLDLDAERARVYALRAETLRAVGRLPEALADYDRAFDLHRLEHLAARRDLDEDRAKLYVVRASALWDAGRLEEALEGYAHAVALHDREHLAERSELAAERAELFMSLGGALHDAGRLDESIEACERALHALGPESAWADLEETAVKVMVNLAGALVDVGRFEEATARYQHALDLHALDHLARRPELDATRASIHMNRAVARTRAGDLHGALEDYSSALALHELKHLAGDPEHEVDRVQIYSNVATVFLEADSPDEALDSFDLALDLLSLDHLADRPELDLRRVSIETNRGVALRRLGRSEETLEGYERALRLLALEHFLLRPEVDAERARVHFNRAVTLVDLGHVDKACSDFDRALELLDGSSLTDWAHLDGYRAKTMAAASALLPHRADADAWARRWGARLLDLVETAPALGPDAAVSEAVQLRLDFRRFHSHWLSYCLEDGSLDTVPRILAVTQGRELAASVLDAAAADLGSVPPEVASFTDLRQALRDTRHSLAARATAVRSVKADPKRIALREREYRLRRELSAARERAARAPGFGLLHQSHHALGLERVREALRPDEALLCLLESQGNGAGALVVQRDRPARWMPFDADHLHAVTENAAAIERQLHDRSVRAGALDAVSASDDADASWSAVAEAMCALIWDRLDVALRDTRRLSVVTHGDLHGLPLLAGVPEHLTLRFYPGIVFFALHRGLYPEHASDGGDHSPPPLALVTRADAGEGKGVGFIPMARIETELAALAWQARRGAAHVEAQSQYPEAPLAFDGTGVACELLHIACHGFAHEEHGAVLVLPSRPWRELATRQIASSKVRPRAVYLGACFAAQTIDGLDGDPGRHRERLFPRRGAHRRRIPAPPSRPWRLPARIAGASRGPRRGSTPRPRARARQETPGRKRLPEQSRRLRRRRCPDRQPHTSPHQVASPSARARRPARPRRLPPGTGH